MILYIFLILMQKGLVVVPLIRPKHPCS